MAIGPENRKVDEPPVLRTVADKQKPDYVLIYKLPESIGARSLPTRCTLISTDISGMLPHNSGGSG